MSDQQAQYEDYCADQQQAQYEDQARDTLRDLIQQLGVGEVAAILQEFQ